MRAAAGPARLALLLISLCSFSGPSGDFLLRRPIITGDRQDTEGARTRRAKESDLSSARYARRFWIPTALALFTPPTLLALALSIHSPSVMNLVLFSSFICVFISLIAVLSAFILWMFGKVQFIHIRLATALGLLGFVTNYFVFYFVVYKFYRPH